MCQTKAVGFNPAVIHELCKLGEMKIKKGLVLEKDTEKLVGFLDLGDEDLNCASFSNPQELASHVFVYYVRGDIKFCLGYFATRTMDSKCCGTGNLWDFRKFVGLQETCGTSGNLWDFMTRLLYQLMDEGGTTTTATICHYHHHNHHHLSLSSGTTTTNCHYQPAQPLPTVTIIRHNHHQLSLSSGTTHHHLSLSSGTTIPNCHCFGNR